jgi:hypothetical protein
VYDAESKLSRQDLLLQTCILMQAKSWQYSVLADTHTHTHALSRARCLSGSLSPSASLSLSYTHTHVCSRMLAYGGVWWRMVEWMQFGDVRHDTAVSLYPTIASFNTYRLPYTPVASLISHIAYATLVSPPSYRLFRDIASCISDIGYADG